MSENIEKSEANEKVNLRATSGEALVRALRRRHERRKEKLAHPRKDKIWIKREDGQLNLSLGKANEKWALSRSAWQDLASLLCITPPLLEKLSRLPKDEDCRLINALLWDRGSEADGQVKILIVDDTVMRIAQPDYRSLSAERLAGTLETLEKKNIVKVIRWDLSDLGWWIIVGFPNIAPIDFSESIKGKDTWEASALLFNHEDGKTAAAVVPGLSRNWGKLWLPISQGHIRRHDGDGDVLMDVVRALQNAEKSDFNGVGEKLIKLQDTRVGDGALWLGKLGSPWIESHKQAVKAGFMGGRPTGYRIVTAAMRVAYTIDDPVKRLAMLRLLGNVAIAQQDTPRIKRGKNDPS